MSNAVPTITFSDPIEWITLIAVFVFVVTPWAKIATFGNAGVMTRARYLEIQDAAGQTWIGFIVSGLPWLLWALQVIRNLALWITWTFYIFLGPALPPNENYYIAVNALIFAGVVFHQTAEVLFWDVRQYAFSGFMRLLELVVFIAALVLAIIEWTRLDDDDVGGVEEEGTNVALWIVLIIVVLHTFWLLLRSLAFWWASSDIGLDQDETDPLIVPTGASVAAVNAAAAKARAAQAAFSISPKNK